MLLGVWLYEFQFQNAFQFINSQHRLFYFDCSYMGCALTTSLSI